LLSREFIQILERQLRLTPEQRERVDKIMTEGQERVRELRARIDPEMRKELQQAREQIRSVLTPEQREQFEQMMKRSPRRGERGEQPGQPDRRFHDSRNPPPGGEPRDGQPQPQPLNQ
jgi:Spy/CpxP family protein refolding chaperone